MLPDIPNLIVFIGASLAVIFTPGQAMLYILSRGMGQGRTAGMISAFGVVVGAVAHTFLAALGLSALLASSDVAFDVVRFVGAAYLVYLGIAQLLSGGLTKDIEGVANEASTGRLFIDGVLANLLNPKLAIFFLFFLPQFADPARGSVVVQMILLGLIYNFFVLMVQGSVGILSGTVGDWLRGHRRFLAWQRRVTGSVLVALGVGLAFSRR